LNLYVIRELTKRYRPRGVLANDAISLDIRQGEILGIFGPNGAGKTTLVRQITALLRPCSGRIELLGQDVVRHPAVVPQYVGFFWPAGPHPAQLYRGRGSGLRGNPAWAVRRTG
jgi:ABC-type multidrug transport system ATPase subunit